jgi:hypothetical protein
MNKRTSRYVGLLAVLAVAVSAHAGMYVAGVPALGPDEYQFNASATASICVGWPDTPSPDDVYLSGHVGWKGVGMMKFDVSGLAGLTVQSAKLYLNTAQAGSNSSNPDMDVNLTPLGSPWDKTTVTWNTYGIGNFGSSMDSVTLNTTDWTSGWVELTVTPSLVQGWIDTPSADGYQGLGLVPVWEGAAVEFRAFQQVLVVNATPEPATLGLLGIGGLLSFLRRRR